MEQAFNGMECSMVGVIEINQDEIHLILSYPFWTRIRYGVNSSQNPHWKIIWIPACAGMTIDAKNTA